MRRATRACLGAIFALTLPGCAAMSRCAAPVASVATAQALGQAGALMRGAGFDGARVLDGVLAQLGPAILCLVSGLAAPRAETPQTESPTP